MQKSKSLLSLSCITVILFTTTSAAYAAQLNQTQAKQYATDAYNTI